MDVEVGETRGSLAIAVRTLTRQDKPWAARLERLAWGGYGVARKGELLDLRAFPGLVALAEGEPCGLARYAIRGADCELVSIQSEREGLGVGRALLAAVRQAATEAGCRRLWLITTNDNTRALRFYQRAGFDIVALHRDAVTQARRDLKPAIPLRGADGIRLRHELVLELLLDG